MSVVHITVPPTGECGVVEYMFHDFNMVHDEIRDSRANRRAHRAAVDLLEPVMFVYEIAVSEYELYSNLKMLETEMSVRQDSCSFGWVNVWNMYLQLNINR